MMMNIWKIANQEADNQYKKGRNDAFDDVLQWYNQISENGEKLVTVNQIIMYIQEKLEKTKSSLNLDDNNTGNTTYKNKRNKKKYYKKISTEAEKETTENKDNQTMIIIES